MEDSGRFVASNGGGSPRIRRRSKASELAASDARMRGDPQGFEPKWTSHPRKRMVEPQGGHGRSDAMRLSTEIFEGCEQRRGNRVGRFSGQPAMAVVEASTRETRRTLMVGSGMQQAREPQAEQAAEVVRNHGRRRSSRRIARRAEGRETGPERDAGGDVDGESTSRIPREAGPMRFAASAPRETGARKGNRPRRRG